MNIVKYLERVHVAKTSEGHDLYKFGRAPLPDASYQVSGEEDYKCFCYL